MRYVKAIAVPIGFVLLAACHVVNAQQGQPVNLTNVSQRQSTQGKTLAELIWQRTDEAQKVFPKTKKGQEGKQDFFAHGGMGNIGRPQHQINSFIFKPEGEE